MKHKCIAVLTSGGDAAGMNAAVRAVTRSAIAEGGTVFGVENGYRGLVEDRMRPLAARDVGGILQLGGTVLGSARSERFPTDAGRAAALDNLRKRGIDGLVVIGGNGSQTGAATLVEDGFPVVGVASTIDNDLYGTDMSLGVDTALNVIVEAIDRIRSTASSHRRAFVVETMGRGSGYLALMAGLAGGAEAICVPETDVAPERIASAVEEAYRRGKTHAIVVVAEGASCNAACLKSVFEERKKDGFGVRTTILGHVQRGGRPTVRDRVLGSRLGAQAARALMQGQSGVLVGVDRDEIVHTPLAEIAGKARPLDPALMELALTLAQ